MNLLTISDLGSFLLHLHIVWNLSFSPVQPLSPHLTCSHIFFFFLNTYLFCDLVLLETKDLKLMGKL